MDNFFDYIIILFLIYGVYKSLVNKKKKTGEETEAEDFESAQASTQKRKRTVLEEILGVPPIEPDPVEPESGPKSYQEEYSSWDPEQEFSNKQNPDPQFKQEVQIQKQTTQRIVQDAPEKVNQILPIEEVEISTELEKINELKEKLLNPSELRDYILVSEILNKPKAFQD